MKIFYPVNEMIKNIEAALCCYLGKFITHRAFSTATAELLSTQTCHFEFSTQEA